jgi:hypothetical protein
MNAKIAHAVAALAATAFLSNAAAVHATVITPDEEFTFTGQCTDCTGTGIGVLTLSGYTQGNGLALSNFVSFTYKSNLLNLSYDVATYIRGNLVNLPGKDYVVMVFNGGVAFYSLNTGSGSWCIGNNCEQDMGPSSLWTMTTATTPLPATLPLFASGLGVWGLLGWRRKQKASAIAG